MNEYFSRRKNFEKENGRRRLKGIKSMKKILAVCLVIITALSLAACAQAPQSKSETVKIKDMDKKYGLTQLCADLNKKEYIPEEGTKMEAQVIGAVTGYRFTTKVKDSNVTIERYEFDKDKLNEDAQKVISEVKEKGYFNMLGYQDVPAELSDNEKYMIIYRDDKAGGDNPEQENKERKEAVMKIFNSAK